MFSQNTIKCLYILALTFGLSAYNYCQTFNGKIYYSLESILSEKGVEIEKQLKQSKAIIVSENPNFIKEFHLFYICGDTLIKIYLNHLNDTTAINVQIDKKVYIGWPFFFQFNSKSGLNLIDNFKKTGNEEFINGVRGEVFQGQSTNEGLLYIMTFEPQKKYLKQSMYGYLFGDIFSHHGLALKEDRKNSKWFIKRTQTLTKFEQNKCSCDKIFYQINFNTAAKKEKITIDQILLKNGKDTTIIEDTDRQLLAFQGRNTLLENVNAEVISGHYTLIDLWATWCQPCLYAMPALADIYEKYRYDGLKVVSISLDGESAKEKWKKTIEKENMYWDNYIMPEGFDADLCRQLGIKAIPHYILLDPEGRIMLENAPGPSDPMLKDVLDRVLKGRK